MLFLDSFNILVTWWINVWVNKRPEIKTKLTSCGHKNAISEMIHKRAYQPKNQRDHTCVDSPRLSCCLFLISLWMESKNQINKSNLSNCYGMKIRHCASTPLCKLINHEMTTCRSTTSNCQGNFTSKTSWNLNKYDLPNEQTHFHRPASMALHDN